MRLRSSDMFTAWSNNLGFMMSHMGPDVYVYIGDAEEIPDELLSKSISWAIVCVVAASGN